MGSLAFPIIFTVGATMILPNVKSLLELSELSALEISQACGIIVI